MEPSGEDSCSAAALCPTGFVSLLVLSGGCLGAFPRGENARVASLGRKGPSPALLRGGTAARGLVLRAPSCSARGDVAGAPWALGGRAGRAGWGCGPHRGAAGRTARRPHAAPPPAPPGGGDPLRPVRPPFRAAFLLLCRTRPNGPDSRPAAPRSSWGASGRGGRRLPHRGGSGPPLPRGPPAARGQPPDPPGGAGGLGPRLAPGGRAQPRKPPRLRGRVSLSRPRRGRVLQAHLAGGTVPAADRSPLRPHPALQRRRHQNSPEEAPRPRRPARAAAGPGAAGCGGCAVRTVLPAQLRGPGVRSRPPGDGQPQGPDSTGTRGRRDRQPHGPAERAEPRGLLLPQPRVRRSYRRFFPTLRGRGRRAPLRPVAPGTPTPEDVHPGPRGPRPFLRARGEEAAPDGPAKVRPPSCGPRWRLPGLFTRTVPCCSHDRAAKLRQEPSRSLQRGSPPAPPAGARSGGAAVGAAVPPRRLGGRAEGPLRVRCLRAQLCVAFHERSLHSRGSRRTYRTSQLCPSFIVRNRFLVNFSKLPLQHFSKFECPNAFKTYFASAEI